MSQNLVGVSARTLGAGWSGADGAEATTAWPVGVLANFRHEMECWGPVT